MCLPSEFFCLGCQQRHILCACPGNRPDLGHALLKFGGSVYHADDRLCGRIHTQSQPRKLGGSVLKVRLCRHYPVQSVLLELQLFQLVLDFGCLLRIAFKVYFVFVQRRI